MGTSNANEGQGGRTPLVPSWLPAGPPAPWPPPPNQAPQPEPAPMPPVDAPETPSTPFRRPTVSPTVPIPPMLPAIPEFGDADRFRTPRTNFTRFARSGGSDRGSLGRALSGYVSISSGGSRTAARRMGSSRTAGSQLLGFLSSAVANGVPQALRSLNLEKLVGRPIEEVFLGLMDFVCPFDGGTVDEGIARDAFVETIADLQENGIVDLDGLNIEQMQTIFELYASHAIENRICNDIGTQTVTVPSDAAEAASVQRQLLDFIRRSVSDSLNQARAAMETLTPVNIGTLVNRIYEQAFGILQSLAEAEADKE
jgi:hypothetical protein